VYTMPCGLTDCAFLSFTMSSGVPSFKGPLPGGRLYFPDNPGTFKDATISRRSPSGQHCWSTSGFNGLSSRAVRTSLKARCCEILRWFLNLMEGCDELLSFTHNIKNTEKKYHYKLAATHTRIDSATASGRDVSTFYLVHSH
jgi:hypothetical protein